MPPYKKIAIIGNAGSGKTTLAMHLHKRLQLPLHHLDQYYWLPGWQRMDYEQFRDIHTKLCEQEAWIIEGSNLKVVYERMLHADVIIFLDMPRSVCLGRVLKRTIAHLGRSVPGTPDHCKQHIFSHNFVQFLKWVWRFNGHSRRLIMHFLENDCVHESKRVVVLKSPQHVAAFLERLEDEM
jgi:adenylate kinase family enzyme